MPEIIQVGGLTLRFLRSRHDTAGALDMFEMTVPPEGRMPVAHFHHDWEETVYGLTGRTIWTIAGETIEVATGETAFIPRGVVHGFANTSGETATCLSVLTPGVLGPGYFRELGAAITDTTSTPASMRAIMERHGLIPAG